MKNVRLFAVAAALGMFASTVAAAETTTKTVQWSESESVIKVDLGEKIVVKTPTATVTSTEEKVTVGSVFAVDYEVNQEQNWLYNDAFNWSNADDAMKLLGLNGYRFLAPGSVEVDEEVFVDQASGTVYEDIESMFEALVAKKYVDVKYTEDGNIKYVDIAVDWSYYPATGKVNTTTYIRLTSNSEKGRYDEHIMEDVVDYLVNGTVLDDTQTGYYTAQVFTTGTENASSARAGIKVEDAEDSTIGWTLNPTSVAYYGAVVAVESKRGENYIPKTGSFVMYGEDKVAYTAKPTYKNEIIAGVGTASDLTAVGNLADGQEVYGYNWTANGTEGNTEETAHTYTVTLTSGNFTSTLENLTAADAGLLVKYNTATEDYSLVGVETEATHMWTGTGLTSSVYTSQETVANVKSTPATNLTTSVKYVAGLYGSDEFTSANVKYLTNALNTIDATKKDGGIITAEYETIPTDNTTTKLDKIAYVTMDELGYTTRHIVDYTEADIYYEVQGNETGALGTLVGSKNAGDLVKINKYNDDVLFVAGNMANFYVGSTKLSSLNGNVYPQYNQATYGYVDGYAGLVECEYDYVRYGLGYNHSSKANATNWTYGKDVFGIAGAAGANATVRAYEAYSYTNPLYNQFNKLGKPGTVAIVDISDIDEDATGVQAYQGATLVERITIEGLEDYELDQNYLITVGETVTVEKTKDTVTGLRNYTDTGVYANIARGAYGIYEITDLPANETDKYVIVADTWENGELVLGNGLDLSKVWSYSEAKEIGTLDALDGSDIDCLAVQLEKKGEFYPAFKTYEELVEAVKAMTGLDTALVGKATDKQMSSFKAWYVNNFSTADDGKTTDAPVGLIDNDVNFTELYLGMKSSGEIEETKVVDSTSTDVKVTSNIADIDTTKAGVYDLVYTANYAGEEVGTTSVKVVVAPNYTRTWENGRVKTLTSYYVSNPSAKYAEYVYDWAAGTATVTYYTVDGAVADTATITL